MDAIQLLLLSILLLVIGSLASLLLSGSRKAAQVVSGSLALLASLIGIASMVTGLRATTPPNFTLFHIEPFGGFVLQMDALSAFLVGLIALISVATSIYWLSSGFGHPAIGFFTNLFIASMLLVVTTSNAFYFLMLWELMTLASYFLVIWETKKKEAVVTGFLYLLVAHAGAALIMLSFLLLFLNTGSFDFIAFREASLTPGLKNLLFLLALVGFGAKAGMVPLHFWTPSTYAAAPDHVSALMAGVMKKTAVYGILRVCIDLLGVSEWWWGFVILLFGVLSTVLGAFYALSERNIKRLLAYSSVENVGIILIGIGVGVIGLTVQQPVLAVLGFLAALYHLLNHAFFKGLLFLGAGSVIAQTNTPDLNRMGGLGRRMPWTALSFLFGAIAVCAIPPMNGFISEWFTYQVLFAASKAPLLIIRIFSPIFAVLLALAGALAVMVYIKAYGGAFTGPPRSEAAGSAREAPWGMLVSMGYLALGCMALGLGAPFLAPWVARIAADFTKLPALAVSNGWQVFPTQVTQAVLSPPLVAVSLLGLLIVPLLIVVVYGGFRAGQRSGVEPWACGYGYSSRMSIAASSFDQPVKASFQPLYWIRTLVDKPFRAISDFSRSTVRVILRAEPVVEMLVTRPTTRMVERAGQLIQLLQMGDIRVYCMYIVLTLVVLLIVIFGGRGL